MKITPLDIGYIKIADQSTINLLMDLTNGFHDSIIKEFRLTENAFLDRDNSLFMNFKMNGKLILQSQWLDKDIELLFTRINKINWIALNDIWGGNFKFIKDNIETISLILDKEFEINANHIFYKLVNGSINTPVLGDAVPDDEMSQADKLGENWVQCQNCAESWVTTLQIDKCPDCNMTAIIR